MNGGLESETHFVLLTLDDLALLLPQQGVRTLEPVFDVDFSEGTGVGRLPMGEESVPVYCLSGSLQPLSTPPPRRRICVVLERSRGRFGVLCDSLDLFGSVSVQPLPACMGVFDTPIQGLALYDRRVLCLSSPEALWNHLDSEAAP